MSTARLELLTLPSPDLPGWTMVEAQISTDHPLDGPQEWLTGAVGASYRERDVARGLEEVERMARRRCKLAGLEVGEVSRL